MMLVKKVLFFVLIGLFCAANLLAQNTKGTITRTVLDTNGDVVSGATVALLLFSVGVAQSFRRGITSRLWLDYTSNYFLNAQNTLRGGTNTLVNASVNIPFRDNRFNLQIFATNLFNSKYFYYGAHSVFGIDASPGQPLQVYASLKYRFK